MSKDGFEPTEISAGSQATEITGSEVTEIEELRNLHERLNGISSFSDKHFELLSTIRYDPNLSEGSTEFSEELSASAADNEHVLQAHLLGDFIGPEQHTGDSFADINDETLKDIYFYRFMLLGEHVKRIQFTLTYFRWTDFEVDVSFLMDLLIKALPVPVSSGGDSELSLKQRMVALYDRKECYKMRVLINKHGEVRCEAHVLPSTNHVSSENYLLNNLLVGFLDEPPTYTVYIYDTQITPSCFTSFKTTFRSHYNKAREQMMALHAGKDGPCEILLFNTGGELMEGSISNCYIRMYMGENWFYTTPALSSGCLCGVMRNFLLSKRLVTETKKITIHQLRDGDEILLSNGIMGLVKGRIVKPDALRLK